MLKVCPIIYSTSFNLFFLYRRQHLNNWSMTKENRDPIGVLATDVPSNETMKLSAHKNHTLDKGRMPNSPKTSSVNNATDLFELLERCQSQRLDDQRCVLPSYFSQVSWTVTVSRQTAALFLIPSRPPFFPLLNPFEISHIFFLWLFFVRLSWLAASYDTNRHSSGDSFSEITNISQHVVSSPNPMWKSS